MQFLKAKRGARGLLSDYIQISYRPQNASLALLSYTIPACMVNLGDQEGTVALTLSYGQEGLMYYPEGDIYIAEGTNWLCFGRAFSFYYILTSLLENNINPGSAFIGPNGVI